MKLIFSDCLINYGRVRSVQSHLNIKLLTKLFFSEFQWRVRLVRVKTLTVNRVRACVVIPFGLAKKEKY